MLNGRADEPKPNVTGRPDETAGPSGPDADDEGLSLERLSQAFARAMEGHQERQSGDRQSAETTDEDGLPDEHQSDEDSPVEPVARDRLSPERRSPAARTSDRESGRPGRTADRQLRTDSSPSPTVDPDDPEGFRTKLDLPLPALPGSRLEREVDVRCPISPRSIAEAILFVGHPENQPLSSRLMAALMRGVSPAEVDQLVEELNANYLAEQAPYEIAVVAGGFMLQLRPEYSRLRNKLYGRVREARLSQAAIEVLALVAYNQPVGRERIDQLRGKPSGALLSQLVRRDLLSVERSTERPREMVYRTTERFLDIFGLDSLDDLPQADGPNSLEP
ncbi:MAG: SMC-Scp complex subunit ScpB [Pirellulales bacterium]